MSHLRHRQFQQISKAVNFGVRFDNFKELTFDLQILSSFYLRSVTRNRKTYVYIMAKMFECIQMYHQMYCTPVLFEIVNMFDIPNIQFAKCFMPPISNPENVSYAGRNSLGQV